MPSEEFPIEYQNELQDCAPACLKMIADYYGKSSSALAPLYEHCHLSDMGATILDIRKAAGNLGFHTLAVQCTMDDLLNEIPLPAIAFWKSCHFIVVYASNEEYIFIADPAIGPIIYTYEEFKYGWYSKDKNSGALVVFEQPSENSDTKQSG